MTILNTGAGPFPELARTARKYFALAEDLTHIARGEHPTENALQTAPQLTGWRVYIAPRPHLVGVVMGHPYLENGRVITTSELFTFDPFTGYARTYSRFYRLGPHFQARSAVREP